MLAGMNEKSEAGEVVVERLDEIPVVIGMLLRMRIQAIIDENMVAHGNWQGLSPGWVILIWIAHILTQHNHCMDRVQEWVSKRITTLQLLTGQPVTELDFTDDRLALCLGMLSQTRNWHRIETQVGSHLVRVYRLSSRIVRLDATTGTVNHDPKTQELFQIGKAKNGQYEVQFKLMLASLDPLGLSLVVDVVSGERADDPLYVPCYKRVKQVLPESGLLIVGDSKMSALETRATIAAGEDYYLTPLAYL
ncbi:MAG: DUF4277 domain-containing protein, partial [Anaerolineales bacterium]|nr:DUF4277 domain-containing protein [Anaerolineales bacterium]